jgi:Tfp pilus assembly protein PilF
MPTTLPSPDLLAHAEQLHAAGQLLEALHCIDAALRLNPVDPIAHCRRGLVFKGMRRWDDALACFDKGIALRPDLAPAHLDRGNALQELGRLAESLAAYDNALRLQPRYPAALCNRGTVLHRLNRLDESIAAYDTALAIDPRLEEARFNRSTALNDAGRHAEALEGFAHTLQRYPDLAVAHWNEALCRLRLGDFARGWPKFEWRWRYRDLGLKPRPYPQAVWLGKEAIAGRTLLLTAEQGLGDTLQFCRYVPLLARRGARVLLEVQEPLVTLLRSLDGAAAVSAQGQDPEPFDLQTPLLSLPLAMGTELATIPAQVPYLHPEAARMRVWHERLGSGGVTSQTAKRRRLRIGLAWSGNPQQANDYNRSMAVDLLKPLTELEADFFSLQTAVRPSDVPHLAIQKIHHWAADLHDFSDTAALAANLDLIISVCTSTAHLAGALGLPVWVLLNFAADWRWLHGRDDSPWYPTARLFRQRAPGDWHGVIAAVRAQLQALVQASSEG